MFNKIKAYFNLDTNYVTQDILNSKEAELRCIQHRSMERVIELMGALLEMNKKHYEIGRQLDFTNVQPTAEFVQAGELISKYINKPGRFDIEMVEVERVRSTNWFARFFDGYRNGKFMVEAEKEIARHKANIAELVEVISQINKAIADAEVILATLREAVNSIKMEDRIYDRLTDDQISNLTKLMKDTCVTLNVVEIYTNIHNL